MNIVKGHKLLMDFINQCRQDKDPYFIVHFSKIDDKFIGYSDGMDQADVLIIIDNLISSFHLDRSVIATMKTDEDKKIQN